MSASHSMRLQVCPAGIGDHVLPDSIRHDPHGLRPNHGAAPWGIFSSIAPGCPNPCASASEWVASTSSAQSLAERNAGSRSRLSCRYMHQAGSQRLRRRQTIRSYVTLIGSKVIEISTIEVNISLIQAGLLNISLKLLGTRTLLWAPAHTAALSRGRSAYPSGFSRPTGKYSKFSVRIQPGSRKDRSPQSRQYQSFHRLAPLKSGRPSVVLKAAASSPLASNLSVVTTPTWCSQASHRNGTLPLLLVMGRSVSPYRKSLNLSRPSSRRVPLALAATAPWLWACEAHFWPVLRSRPVHTTHLCPASGRAPGGQGK
jgi:hypothetical protein